MKRTPEQLAVLYDKFDSDVIEHSKGMRLALALDQLGNVLFLNGSMDETMSSHIGRNQEKGISTKFQDKLCCLLSKLEYNHCYKSRGE